jgi:hypothetical protein
MHRFSGFIQARQCGDDVLRMFVTGGPPNLGGGGITEDGQRELNAIDAAKVAAPKPMFPLPPTLEPRR